MNILKKLFMRIRHCLTFFFMPDHGLLWGILSIIRQDYGFSRSVANRACLNAEGKPVPWYTYPAIEFLSQFDFSKISVFEYGSGNSTLWWSEQAEKVTSVEHDPHWFKSMENTCSQAGNVDYILQTDAEKYVAELSEKHDVIIVDANWRDLCSVCALQYVAEGGMIILDDSERVQSNKEYQNALKHLRADNRFIQIDFCGFAPLVDYSKITTLFIAKDFNIPRKKGLQPQACLGSVNN